MIYNKWTQGATLIKNRLAHLKETARNFWLKSHAIFLMIHAPLCQSVNLDKNVNIIIPKLMEIHQVKANPDLLIHLQMVNASLWDRLSVDSVWIAKKDSLDNVTFFTSKILIRASQFEMFLMIHANLVLIVLNSVLGHVGTIIHNQIIIKLKILRWKCIIKAPKIQALWISKLNLFLLRNLYYLREIFQSIARVHLKILCAWNMLIINAIRRRANVHKEKNMRLQIKIL